MKAETKTKEVKTIQDKDAVVLGNKAQQIYQQIVETAITDVESYRRALGILVQLVEIKTALESRRKFFSQPLYEQMRRVNDYFGQWLKPLEEAEKLLRQKIVDYRKKLKEELKQKEEQIYEQIKEEFGADELPLVEVVGNLAKTESVAGGEIQVRVVKKWEIEDESKLPREFLKPDEKKIGEAVKKGQEIPGVRVYTEEELAVKIL